MPSAKPPIPPENQNLDRLAATLARISSSARRSTDVAEIVALLEETYLLLGLTIPDAEPALATELTQIRVIIKMWKKSWVTARKIPQQRTLLAVQAWQWSNQVTKFSRITA